MSSDPHTDQAQRRLAGIVQSEGIEREVSLFMLQDEALAPGGHMLIHVGYAIQRVRPQETRSTWELLEEVLEFHA